MTMQAAFAGSALSAGFINQFLETQPAEFAYDSYGRIVGILAGTSGNLLSLADTAFLPGIGDWADGTNCTVSLGTYQTIPVLWSVNALIMTSQAAGLMSAGTAGGTAGVPVTAGPTYTGLAWIEPASTTETCYAQLNFFNSSGVNVGTVNGTPVAESGWTQLSSTAVAPTGAAYASLVVVVENTAAAGEAHHVGLACLSPGTDLTPIDGQALLSFIYHTNGQIQEALFMCGGAQAFSARAFTFNAAGQLTGMA